MPLYEYECQHCRRLTEKIQKFSDAPLTACPHCGGPVEKVLHAPAVSFKGGGWYADLYSSGKTPKAGDKSGQSEAGGGASAGEKPGTGDTASSSGAKESAPASAPAASAPASAPAGSGTKA